MSDLKLKTDDKGLPVLELGKGLAGDPVLNGIILSINIPKGTWWYNVTFGLDWPKNQKLTVRSPDILKERLRQALKWMFDAGLLASLEIEAERSDRNRMGVRISATAPDGREVKYSTFVGVS